MTTYLQLNPQGTTSDSLLTTLPSGVSADYVEMDVYFDSPQQNSYAYVLGNTSIRINNGTLQFGTGVSGFVMAQRTVLKIDLIANGATQNILSVFYRGNNGMGFNGYSCSGRVYDVKYYSGGANGTLLAHYDMNTGTVVDQSGNGNDAVLNGGTWVTDTPTGTPVTVDFVTKQILFSSRQMDAITEQQLFKSRTSDSLMKQRLFNTTSTDFATMQQFTNSGGMVTNFSMKLVIYGDRQTDFKLKEMFTKTTTSDHFMKQQMTAQRQDHFQTLQKLFSVRQNVFILNQIITKQIELSVSLQQQFTKLVESEFATVLKLVKKVDIPFSTKQVIVKQLQKKFATVQQLTSIRSYDYTTKQNMLKGYVEFQKTLEFTLDLLIEMSNDLDFVQSKVQDVDLLIQKFYDLQL